MQTKRLRIFYSSSYGTARMYADTLAGYAGLPARSAGRLSVQPVAETGTLVLVGSTYAGAVRIVRQARGWIERAERVVLFVVGGSTAPPHELLPERIRSLGVEAECLGRTEAWQLPGRRLEPQRLTAKHRFMRRVRIAVERDPVLRDELRAVHDSIDLPAILRLAGQLELFPSAAIERPTVPKAGSRPTIAVFGATGRQGGAVARSLLSRGEWQVRAMTRSPRSGAARVLEALGADVQTVDVDDAGSVRTAVSGCDAVFSVQNYWARGVGYEGEVRQGRMLADIASEVGVTHFLQSAMAPPANPIPEDLHHFASKAAIVEHLSTLGMPFSALGTYGFMDLPLYKDLGGDMMLPFLRAVHDRDVPFPFMALDDLGEAACAVLAEGPTTRNAHVSVLSDAPTLDQVAILYDQMAGRPSRSGRLPSWLVRLLNGEFATQVAWQNAGGWHGAVSDLPRLGVVPTTYQAFLEKHLPFRL